MKRSVKGLCAAAVLTAAVVGVGVAFTRPQWFSSGTGRAQEEAGKAEDAGLFCKEHGVPEKLCTLCHAELRKTLMLCKEHGDIPEDICTKCHPEVEKKYNLVMCPKGHGLPKEFCVECGKTTSSAVTSPDDGWCAAHNVPESLCDACKADPKAHDEGRAGAKAACRQPLPLVKLASAGLAKKVGIKTATVTEEEHAHTLTANAETAYDANAYAEIAPRVGGFLREVRADLGKAVRKGEVLAVVDSAEVSAAKAQYITSQAAVQLAQVTYDRTKPLARTGSLAGKAELEALTALNQAKAGALDARQRLRNFGFGEGELARIVAENDTDSFLDVVAPHDGVVVVRHAVQGEPVQATSQLFAVADTSRMWLWIDVYESDVESVKSGQTVRFTVSGADAPASSGRVNWVGTEVTQKTRTTRVRAELANPDGKLRANQFGRAEIQVGEGHKATLVPKAAVQRKDQVDLVFLPEGEGVFRPQRVVAKPTDRSDVLEVAWGLTPGQRVVTGGAFLLKTEIMKGAIGAGCCE